MSVTPRRTARLVLEPLREEHLDEWLTALADPEIGRYIGGPDVGDRDALAERIRALLAGPPPDFPERTWVNLMVRDLADGTMVGRVEAAVYGTWAEVAYVFAPRVWGRGYAAEATAELLAALAEQGVVESLAAVHPDNAASVALLQRLGFVRLPAPDRAMGSYDPGDLVFLRR
jgi:RimJ/RimL family protein N-acetyltransferase